MHWSKKYRLLQMMKKSGNWIRFILAVEHLQLWNRISFGVLGAITEYFSCEELAEFTVEAGRPDSITLEKLDGDPGISGYQNFRKSTDHESGNPGYYRQTSYSRADKKCISSGKRSRVLTTLTWI